MPKAIKYLADFQEKLDGCTLDLVIDAGGVFLQRAKVVLEENILIRIQLLEILFKYFFGKIVIDVLWAEVALGKDFTHHLEDLFILGWRIVVGGSHGLHRKKNSCDQHNDQYW